MPLLVLCCLILSTPVGAQVATDGGKLCDRPDVIRLRGARGSCRIVITPRKLEKKFTCTGSFLAAMTCEVELNAGAQVSTLGITCGTNLRRPTLAQEQLAAVTAFNSLGVVTDSAGKISIVEDAGDYVVASSELAEVTLVERNGQVSGVIQLILPNGRVPLTDLRCH